MNIRGNRVATFAFDDFKVEGELVESSLPSSVEIGH
jgi:hypothetical protein